LGPGDGDRGSKRAGSGLLGNIGRQSINTNYTPEPTLPTKAKDHINFKRNLAQIGTTNLEERIPIRKVSIVYSNVSNSFQTELETLTNPQTGAIRPWRKQLYSESRNSPPIGTLNILARNNSPAKIYKSHMDRNTQIYDHPQPTGMIFSEICNKLAYISDNPLINELTKKSSFVKLRKDQIKSSDHQYSHLYKTHAATEATDAKILPSSPVRFPKSSK
jgi:hypothetical protein